MIKRRAFVIPVITLVIMTALAAIAPAAYADGGDFSTDFIAAGPFTYDHDTGVGGEFGDRHISKTDGVVESLEGGDFECGDMVVYFAEITVEADATGEQDIELDFGFLAEPTGQPGVGHIDLVSASPNTGDSGMSGDTGDTTASIVPGTEEIDTSGSERRAGRHDRDQQPRPRRGLHPPVGDGVGLHLRLRSDRQPPGRDPRRAGRRS